MSLVPFDGSKKNKILEGYTQKRLLIVCYLECQEGIS